MKYLLTYSWMLLLLVSTGLYAQKTTQKTTKPNAKAVPVTPDSVMFSLFNPEDSLGRNVFRVLDAYEHFGHFGAVEDGLKNATFLNEFIALFDSNATIQDDFGSTINPQALPIAQYRSLAKQKGFQAYVLIIERSDTTIAREKDKSGNYYAQVRFFKLFNNKAIMGATQKHGAIYTVGLRLNKDGSKVKITHVTLAPGDEFFNFNLGKYGRHIYSSILVSSNLRTLVQEVPPPYQPKPTPTKSNFFVHAGYQITSFLQPEAMRNNLNANYNFSGTEQGRSIGFKYQKAYAPKDRFGLFFGVEYEENMYDFTHADASFVYTQDQNGNPLVDLEGTTYDKKYVDVASYAESGTLKYVKPEVGAFLNLGGKVFNFQLLGSVGNAFKLSSTYEAQSTVSYKGQIEGQGAPISEDALGFYTDLKTDFGGDHTEVQNFMFYKAGAGLDIILGKHFGLSFLFEYKSSFTYAMRKNTSELMFLDPDTGAGYISQFNTVNDSRLYNALSLQAGFKFYLNEKR